MKKEKLCKQTWDELKEELKDIERKQKRKAYKKEYKKQKKALVKMAKEFCVWDYGYMVPIIFQMIKMFYAKYSDADLVIFDTSEEYNPTWKEEVNALNRCKEIVDVLEEEGVEYINPEYLKEDEINTAALFKELLEIVSEHMYAWWE